MGPGQGQTGSPVRRPFEPQRPLLPGARMPPTAAWPTDLGSATRPGPGSAPSGNWRPVLAALGTWASPARGADSGRPPCPALRVALLWPWGSRGRERPPTAGSLPCASVPRGTVLTCSGGGADAPALLAGTPRLGSGPPASTRQGPLLVWPPPGWPPRSCLLLVRGSWHLRLAVFAFSGWQ